MSSASPKCFEFGRFRVDLGRRMLLDGDGKPVEISARAFDVLVYLVQNTGRVVERAELMDALWPRAVVEENTLSQVVLRLRNAIGEGSVVTVKGRGYQFVEEVRVVATANGSNQSGVASGAPRARIVERIKHARWYALAAVAMLVLVILAVDGRWFEPARGDADTAALSTSVGTSILAPGTRESPDWRSIAVLPFENLSPREEDASFADGMHSEVLTQLAKIGSLKVTSRTSVMEYRGRDRDLREIGEELGVATVLETAVQRAGETVRLNVQLIDAETDEHIWAETYDRELTVENLLAIQSEMAGSIAAELGAMLLPGEAERLAELPTRSSRAYEFYISGRYYESRALGWADPNIGLAIQQYARALDEDPDFALVWTRLSFLHSEVYFFGIDSSEARRQMALEAAEKALALKPDLPEAHFAMGWYHLEVGDLEDALRELTIAEEGMPGDVMPVWARGHVYLRTGRWDEARTAYGRAIELNPRDVTFLSYPALVSLVNRDYADADSYYERILDLRPDHIASLVNQVWLPLFRDGDISAAKSAAARPPYAHTPGTFSVPPEYFGWIAALYERDYESALAWLDAWNDDAMHTVDAYIPKASLYGVTYDLLEQPERARPYYQIARGQVEAERTRSPELPEVWIALGETLAGLGDSEAALDAARRALELQPTSRDAMLGPTLQLDAVRRVFIRAGAFDAALSELEAYFAAPGFWSIEGVRSDPRLDPIRGEPRFQALIQRYGRDR